MSNQDSKNSDYDLQEIAEFLQEIADVIERLFPFLSQFELILQLVQSLGGMDVLLKICSRWSAFLADAQVVPSNGSFDSQGWAALLGTTERTAYRSMNRNNVPHTKVSKKSVFSAADVLRFCFNNGDPDGEEETAESEG